MLISAHVAMENIELLEQGFDRLLHALRRDTLFRFTSLCQESELHYVECLQLNVGLKNKTELLGWY